MRKSILEWAKRFNYKKIKYNNKKYLVIYTTLPKGFMALNLKLRNYKEIILLIDPDNKNNKKLFHRTIKNNKLIKLNIYM